MKPPGKFVAHLHLERGVCEELQRVRRDEWESGAYFTGGRLKVYIHLIPKLDVLSVQEARAEQTNIPRTSASARRRSSIRDPSIPKGQAPREHRRQTRPDVSPKQHPIQHDEYGDERLRRKRSHQAHEDVMPRERLTHDNYYEDEKVPYDQPLTEVETRRRTPSPKVNDHRWHNLADN